ncbi:zinc finger A20 and AN1 domain-containing stress-associated protein 7-like [Panicum miliaceum]|uniref:Zinc finger A20 and AN1 domain-containing stress-associated protein 7-like n=1 Tax=Panicum miliaceum TaxID=4540 RepID=A0A3L6PKD6_PANMI|nr:zinc finger A20 and AN1 domain-containing stress-associated protein 7-like [Panicum miliaceum]
MAASMASGPPAAEEPATKSMPNRCASCHKKVGLLGFTYRCGGMFCSLHRYAEKDACDFDFRRWIERRSP